MKLKKPTKAIRQLSQDFGFKIRFCGTRKPMTKGTVESRNKIVDEIAAHTRDFSNELAAKELAIKTYIC